MAFFRRSSSILRSAITRLHGHEPNSILLPQQLSAQQGDSVFKSLSPFFGARFMCSVPSTKLFVGGLAWGMDENGLREAFVEYGEVVEAKVVLDRESGRSKGFGFVSFTCTDHAEAAKNGLDGKVLSGRQLRVNFAIEKQRGFGGFSGSYGGGGFGGGDSGSSYGNSSFSSGSSFNNDSFSPSGSTNEGNDSSLSNNTFNPDSLNNASNTNTASGNNDDFFGDDIFDEPGGDDSFGKDENFAQGFK